MEDLNHTSVACGSEINKKDQFDLPVDNHASKNHLPNGLKAASSCDDDVFHHLAMQLSMIDNLAHRDSSRPTTPEIIHSPAARFSPDPAAIDLIQYSGIAAGVTDTEAASNKYFEYHGAVDDHSPEELMPSEIEKRQRNTSTGEISSVLKNVGVCMRLDYPRVKITGEKDIADLAGVSNENVCRYAIKHIVSNISHYANQFEELLTVTST